MTRLRDYARTLTLALVVALAGACDKNQTAPSQSVQTIVPFSPAQPTPFHVSGVVTDEEGRPLSNAEVLINHYDHVGADGQPGHPVQITRTRTDGSGRYQMDILALRNVYRVQGLADVVGMGVAFGGARPYENDVQFLAASTSAVVKNFRIDRFVDLAAGASATVTFRPDVTLCVDVDRYDQLCRYLSITVPTDGILTVNAIPLSAGATIVRLQVLDEQPQEPIFVYGWTTVSYAVKAGEVQRIALRIGSGPLQPRSYSISTQLRTERQ